MRITDADVVWTPSHDSGPGAIRVERHGSKWERTNGERWMPAARAFDFGSKGDPLLSLFILFNTVTVRDGVPVHDAHKAFLSIDEYATTISPDIEGAKA
jgi:hypothetical protein